MKPPKPELQNNRMIRIASRFVLLPFVLAASGYVAVKGLLQRGKPGKRSRADDKVRQSRARRELRGLPPDHVQ